MKARMYLSIFIIFFALFTIAGSCATTNKTISGERVIKIRSGKWVNEAVIEEQLLVFH